MLIMFNKELKDILNKKITKLNGKLLQGKVNHDTAFLPLPNYLQSWFLLGDCSLKTLDKKSPKQSVSFILCVILRSIMKSCIILFLLLGI